VLNSTGITDAGLRNLEQFKSLKSVCVTGCKTSEGGRRSFERSQPGRSILYGR
jgi:hypothetical protein